MEVQHNVYSIRLWDVVATCEIQWKYNNEASRVKVNVVVVTCKTTVRYNHL
jgi:hypothetical protein